MTFKHFIFKPGLWIGEGKITFNTSPEFIKFYTKWEIIEESSQVLKAIQTVEMQGVEEHVINSFTIQDIIPQSFSIVLENELIGKLVGNGVIDSKIVAWEFRGSLALEGFEVYEMQENGDYFLHAEYISPDQLRTIVDGLIWKKGI